MLIDLLMNINYIQIKILRNKQYLVGAAILMFCRAFLHHIN